MEGLEGDRDMNQDGYWDLAHVFHEWTDDMKGPIIDVQTGSRVSGVKVTAFRVIDDQQIFDERPPGQTKTDVLGEWEMKLDPGEFAFNFHKDEYMDETVRRTVT